MIFREYLVCEVRGLAFQLLADDSCFGDVIHFLEVFSGSDGKDRQQNVGSCYVGCFVNTQSHVSIIKIAQVHLFAQSDGANLLCRYAVGQLA